MDTINVLAGKTAVVRTFFFKKKSYHIRYLSAMSSFTSSMTSSIVVRPVLSLFYEFIYCVNTGISMHKNPFVGWQWLVRTKRGWIYQLGEGN